MALKRVWLPSPNYSTRSTGVRLIVLHTAEGARTYQSLGNFFASSSSGVSSHVGIDDAVNTVGEYVKRDKKAWTQANANSYSVAAELCAFAAWTPTEWDKHRQMLANCAAWVAEEAAAFGIPLVRLTASQAQGGSSGVCEHVDLGALGGGHVDCGPGFPIDEVISMAKGSKPQPGPTPQPQPEPTPKPEPKPPSGQAPPLHVDYFGRHHNAQVPDVRTWQQQMHDRGWAIGVDQVYGSESESVCRRFQAGKGLSVDGLVGPQTWQASWTAPVT